MRDFVAIDFETANGRRCSVCSVGLIIVRDGEIVDRFYSLIKPTPNYYSYWTTEIHGLTHDDTMSFIVHLQPPAAPSTSQAISSHS